MKKIGEKIYMEVLEVGNINGTKLICFEKVEFRELEGIATIRECADCDLKKGEKI